MNSKPTVQLLDDSPSARQGWDRFVRRFGGPFGLYHLSGWRDVLAPSIGRKCLYLQAVDDDQVVGVLPMVLLSSRLFGRFLISLPYFNYGGIIAANQDARTALLEAANQLADEHRVSYIELRQTEPNALPLPVSSHRVGLYLELPDDAETLWKRLGSKVRGHIRKARKSGCVFELGGGELVDEFYHIFAINMRDLGTPVWPKRFFADMCRVFADMVRIGVVRGAGRTLAAGVIVHYGDHMEVPSSASLRKYRPLCANNLLFWHFLQFAIEKNCAFFDFGRSPVDSGPYKFKTQHGAEPRPLYWYYSLRTAKQIPQINKENPRYRTLIRTWQRLPVWLSRLLGPPVVRNLP